MLTHSNPVHNKTTQADNLVFDIFGTRLVNLASDSNNFQKLRGFVGFSFLDPCFSFNLGQRPRMTFAMQTVYSVVHIRFVKVSTK